MNKLVVVKSVVLLVCVFVLPAGMAGVASDDSLITDTELVITYEVERTGLSLLSSLFKDSSNLTSKTMKLWVNLGRMQSPYRGESFGFHMEIV